MHSIDPTQYVLNLSVAIGTNHESAVSPTAIPTWANSSMRQALFPPPVRLCKYIKANLINRVALYSWHVCYDAGLRQSREQPLLRQSSLATSLVLVKQLTSSVLLKSFPRSRIYLSHLHLTSLFPTNLLYPHFLPSSSTMGDNNRATLGSDAAANAPDAAAFDKGKGKATEDPSLEMSMDEDEESEESENEEMAEDDDEDGGDNLEPISADNIISGGRRTRGKTIDFQEAAEKIQGDDDDEDDDEEFQPNDDDDNMRD